MHRRYAEIWTRSSQRAICQLNGEEVIDCSMKVTSNQVLQVDVFAKARSVTVTQVYVSPRAKARERAQVVGVKRHQMSRLLSHMSCLPVAI